MKRRRDEMMYFFFVLTSNNRGIYEREGINMLYNMSTGGYILGVFGIKV